MLSENNGSINDEVEYVAKEISEKPRPEEFTTNENSVLVTTSGHESLRV